MREQHFYCFLSALQSLFELIRLFVDELAEEFEDRVDNGFDGVVAMARSLQLRNLAEGVLARLGLDAPVGFAEEVESVGQVGIGGPVEEFDAILIAVLAGDVGEALLPLRHHTVAKIILMN